MKDLEELAVAISQVNIASDRVASIIGRPALRGHIGEFIASKVFNIQLHESAAHKGSDGVLLDGVLAGSTVNVKFYGQHDGLLDMSEDALPDVFLVLTGPKGSAASSSGQVRPICIEHLFLIPGTEALADAKSRNVLIGVTTSFPNAFWDEREVYPMSRSKELNLTQDQIPLLKLFSFKPS
ncbi:MAG: hypothetical protein IH944_07045 [Armatimonadetes bacterium]|nr:hypothetical protein [Armatimonadota bacterium]